MLLDECRQAIINMGCIAAGQSTPLNQANPAFPPSNGAVPAEHPSAGGNPSVCEATEIVKTGRTGSRLARAATPEPQTALPNAAEAVKTRHARAASLSPHADAAADAATVPAQARRRPSAATTAAARAASVPVPARRRPAAIPAAAHVAAAEAETRDEAQDGMAAPAPALGKKLAGARLGADGKTESGNKSNSSGSRLQRRVLAKPGPAAAEAGVQRPPLMT